MTAVKYSLLKSRIRTKFPTARTDGSISGEDLKAANGTVLTYDSLAAK